MRGICDVHIDDGNVIEESYHIKVDDSDDHHQLETTKQNSRKFLNVRSNNKSSEVNKRSIKDNDMNNHDVSYNDINNNEKRDNNSYDNVDDHSDHDDNDDVIAYHLYQFPTLNELSKASETDLRSLGMGYRSKFIIDSMKIIQQNNYELHRSYGSLNEKINSYRGDDNNDDAGVDDSILSHRWFHHLRSYSTLYNNNKEDIEKNIASDKLCRHEMESSYKKNRLMKRVDKKNEMKNSIDDDDYHRPNYDTSERMDNDDDYGYAVKDIIAINHDIMKTTTNKRRRNRGVDKNSNDNDADCNNDNNQCIKLEKNTTYSTTTTTTSSSTSSTSMIELDMISRNHIQDVLMQLPGVGRKVADCISLFSLDQCSIIPIDTHVWSIVSRDYDTTLKEHKSLTPTVYHKVGVIMVML